MVRFFIGMGVMALALFIYAMVDAIQSPRHRIRAISKWAWILVIFFVPLIGPVLWLIIGRPRRVKNNRRPTGPRAPDDDPEFLRQLEIRRRQAARREEETRKRAEAERKKREAEKRRQERRNAESSRETTENNDDVGSSDQDRPEDTPPA